MIWFQGNGLWELISTSDALTCMVLGILTILSICCWSIFAFKWIMLLQREKQAAIISRRIDSLYHMNDLYILTGVDFEAGAGTILAAAIQYQQNVADDYSPQEAELFQGALEQSLENAIQQEHEYLGIISASAGVSPLLGLFGTVWGLIHAFMRIAEKQSADIVTVAPGVAEALITTLAGLLVAIPALIMFHMLQLKVRNLEIQYTQLTEKIIWLYHKTIMHKGQIYEVKKTSSSPDTFVA